MSGRFISEFVNLTSIYVIHDSQEFLYHISSTSSQGTWNNKRIYTIVCNNQQYRRHFKTLGISTIQS